jgi:hypothetical protein
MPQGSGTPERLHLRAVLREAVAAYRAHAGLLLLTAVIVFIPIGLLEAAAHGLEHLDAEDASAAELLGLAGATVVIGITATLGDIFYTGVVAAVVGEHRTGVRRELSHIARTLPYLRLTAVDVVFALAVAIGLVLVIVPGVIVFTWFVLAAPVVEIERRGIRDAFRRSRKLVRGSFWQVLLLLAPVLIVSDEISNLLVSGGLWLLGDGFLGDWVGAVLAEALTVPPFALAAVVATHQLIALTDDPRSSPRTPPRSSRQERPAAAP